MISDLERSKQRPVTYETSMTSCSIA